MDSQLDTHPVCGGNLQLDIEHVYPDGSTAVAFICHVCGRVGGGFVPAGMTKANGIGNGTSRAPGLSGELNRA